MDISIGDNRNAANIIESGPPSVITWPIKNNADAMMMTGTLEDNDKKMKRITEYLLEDGWRP
jgi:methanogenic corrinoid protein MtbC1